MKNMLNLLKKAASLALALLLIFQGLIPSAQIEATYALTDVTAQGDDLVSQPRAGEPANPNEMDGSKIEGIDIHWITPDSETANNGTATPQDILDSDQDLFLATTSTAELQMKYQVEVSFSGQYDYAPGDIQITIPAQVWHARLYAYTAGNKNGIISPSQYVGGMDLSVPMAPSTKADFNWQLIDGNYVLTNTKTIGATSKAMFQFTITNLKPMDIVDMSKCDPITVHCEVVTNQGNVIELTSQPIEAQIDTLAVINATKKEGELYESVPNSMPAFLLSNLPAEDQNPENYIYVRWYTQKRHTANQPFKLDLEDTLSDAYVLDEDGNKQFVTEGIFLGAETLTGTIYPHGQGIDFSAQVHDYKKASSSTYYDNTLVLWSAYKKEDFEIPDGRNGEILYQMENHVEWILTEADGDANGEDAADGQKVTRVEDTAIVGYAPIKFEKPTGHFEVFKWTEQRPNEDWYYGYGLNQLLKGEDVSMRYHLLTRGFGYGWTSVRTNPDDPDFVGEELPTAEEDYGYLGWRQTVEDFDTFFNFDPTSLTSRDFEITYYEVKTPIKYRFEKVTQPTVGYMPAQNTVTASHIVYGTIPAGHYGYLPDDSLPNPDLQIEYQLNNDGIWIPAATATWGETGLGEFQFVDVTDGITVDTATRRVYFPENTTDVRHIFVSNVFGGKTLTHRECWADKENACENCPLPIAAIDWNTYLGIDLKASDEVIAIAESLFEVSDTPATKFKNDVQMEVDGWVYADEDGNPGPGTRLAHDEGVFYDFSRATIAGAGYGASLNKTITFNPESKENGGDNDTENRRVTLHYKSTLTEESNLHDREEYDIAVAENIVVAETKGIWYDLLPEGVTPVMSSIKTSTGETITAKYTIADFRGTGRTLLVVEMDMTPTVSYNNSTEFYYDSAWISFDAYIGWDDIDDLGTNAVNYIAFESRTPELNDGILGTIDGRQGEPDDPLGGMNDFTPSMPADIVAALTGLNPETGDDSRFLYAKVDVNLNVNTSAVSGIAKAVKDDFVTDGWTQGLDGQEQVVVYEGHGYTYRLRVASSESTTTKDMIIYDTIENYHIPDPANSDVQDATKEADFNDKEKKKNWQGDWEGVGQWRGTLQSVDLSDFVAADVAPVLYYSVTPDLTFADSTPDMNQDEKLELFNSGAYDITDGSIWLEAELNASGEWIVPDNLVGMISAVAIDARKDVNGDDFILMPGEALSGYLRMIAPDDNSDPDLWHAKGAYAHKTDADGNPIAEIDWEAATDYKNNMFAFNNTRLKCVQSGAEAGGESSDIMIRNDYTRVGILPGVIGVEKVWDDEDNWDNIRPEEITVTLMRKAAGQGGDYEAVPGADGQPLTVTLNDANEWKALFLQVDLVDDENNQYLFAIDEGEIEGYLGTVTQLSGNSYRLTNTHEPEKVTISGAKQWNDENNAAGHRPEAIEVKLLQDGEVIRTITVLPDSNGDWSYNFGPQYKYAKGGVEHVYTVEENYVAKYVPTSEDYTLLVNDYVPYGDLSVVKKLENATEIAKQKEFTFTIQLFAEQTAEQIEAGEEPKPLLDSYAYDIYQLEADGETWKRVTGGSLTCSSTFKLKGDQKIVIHKLPSESTYAITEEEVEGFRLTGKVNDEGTIRAGELAEAEFTNTYSAKGNTPLYATKTLTGHGMNKNQHKFQIIDMNEGSATYGQAVSTAYSGTATNTQTQVGEAIEGEAVAAFGALNFTEADHGKTFQYQVVEVNAGKPGYTYDAKIINVTVTVVDNGDGTLTVTATNSDTGEDLTLSDGSGMTFENEYDAYGEIVLKAWKTMNRRELEDGEFTFELYRYNPVTGSTVGAAIQTATNDADGNITFKAISFDQDDVSLDEENPAQYAYLVKEVAGGDETVIYSTEQYMYLVTVYDNGDGTLSFDEVVTTPDGTAAVPVFTNDLKPGGLAVKKTAEKGSNVPFTFVVKLTGEGLPEYVSGELSGAQVTAAPTNTPEPTATPKPTATPEPFSVPTVKPTVQNTPRPTVEPSEPLVGSGSPYHASEADLQGQAYVMVDRGTGEMVIFRSDEDNPVDPDGNAFAIDHGIYGENAELNRRYYKFNESRPHGETVHYWDWSHSSQDDADLIKSVRMVDPVQPTNLNGFFRSCRYLETVDLSLMDTSKTTTFGWMFTDCSSLQKLDLSTFDTSSLKSAVDMFRGCTALTEVDVSSFDTSNVIDFASMFQDCKNLLTVDVSQWDTGNATNMLYMFSGCNKLNNLDVSQWDTSKVQNMAYMFYLCYDLGSLDVSQWDTSSVTNMAFMFYGCNKLAELDVSNFDLNGVTTIDNMFNGCYSLAELDVSKWDTSTVTNMSGMFRNCYVLETLDVSNWNTDNVKDMSYMFAECNSLTTLDVSSFNTENVTDFDSMFNGCYLVEELDVSDWDTGKAKNTSAMFYNCRSVEELDVSGWDTSNVTDFKQMFGLCTSLTELDVSGFDTSKAEFVGGMFENCRSLQSVNVAGLDFSSVSTWSISAENNDAVGGNHQIAGLDRMFLNCCSLTELDLSTWDVSTIRQMDYMLSGCTSLASLDLGSWDTSSVTNMEAVFQGCCSLTSLDLTSWDVSSVKTMYSMFEHCCSLTSLDLSTFVTSNVTEMSFMFKDCSALTSLDVSNFDTGSVTDMYAMFADCVSLPVLDVSSFVVGSDTDCASMFRGMDSLEELNIAGFGDLADTEVYYMFGSTDNIRKITIGDALSIYDSSYYSYSHLPRPDKYTKPYDEYWVNEDDASQKYTALELFGDGGHGGTWVWNESYYKLNFDPGEGAGSMASVDVWTRESYYFTPTFYYNGYVLTGFVDEDGNSYAVATAGTYAGQVRIPANTYEDGEEVTLTAQWEERDMTLELTNGMFFFSIYPGETITFNDLPAGTVYEVYEQTPFGWTLVEQNNVSGVIEPCEIETASFVNSQEAKEVSVYPTASKMLDGQPAEEGAFTFQLTELIPDYTTQEFVNGEVLQTVTNSEGGLVKFDPIKYTLEDLGTSPYMYFYYTITEVAGDDDCIVYDDASIGLMVQVYYSDNNLSAGYMYFDLDTNQQLYTTYTFQNTTKPGGFQFTKEITGDLTEKAREQSFDFQITFTDDKRQPWSGIDGAVSCELPGGDSASTLSVDENGVATVTLKAGETAKILDVPAGIRYEIKETGSLPGWTMDGTVVSEKIVSNESPEYTFTNEYHAEGTATIEALKQLVGRNLEDGEFTFQLVEATYDQDTGNYIAGDVLQTATNQLDGTIAFEPITYTEEGTYFYFIREVSGSDNTVEYTEDELLVGVRVQDKDGEGVLTTEVQYWQDVYTLINELKKGELEISKTVVSTYEPHAEQEFEFTITLNDPDGNPVDGSVTLSDGSTLTVTDGEATITLKGGESITLKNLPAGCTYEVVEAEVAGFTTEATGTSGTIQPEETAEAAFTNTYAAKGEYVPKVSKQLTGKDLIYGQFTFRMLDENDQVLQTVSNDENGNAEFAKMLFDHNDAGTKVFKIVEVNSSEAGIEYDKTIYTVTLTITDNGEGQMIVTDDLEGGVAAFENTYDDKTEFSVSKVWNDGDNMFGVRPESITVVLLQDRVEYDTVELNEENGWAYTFTELPAFSEQGVPYLYEAQELPVEGYTSKLTQNESGATITNTVLGMMKVTKIIESGNMEQKFNFTITLTGSDAPVTGEFPATLAGEATTVTFDDSGVYAFQLGHEETLTINGLPIGAAYVVEEENVPGYTATITEGASEGRIQRLEENAVTVTNTGALTEFTVNKQWIDGSGPIELTLYANGVAMDPQPECICENDVYTYQYLVKYDENGEEIVYTAVETPVEGYETTYVNLEPNAYITTEAYNGATIVNEYIPVTELRVTKQWEGGSGPIELTVYANGVKMDPQPVCTRQGDVYVFSGLLKYDEQDQLIVYSAKEKYFDGFVTIYVNEGEFAGESDMIYNGGTIINRQIKEADFQVQKIWHGLDDDERRPAIRLVLYCNGERLDVPTPTPSSNGWYRYHDLPDYYKGVPAVYTVKEEPMSGFTTLYQLSNNEVSDHADNGGCIINVKLPSTGDRSNLTLWISLLALSSVAIIALVVARKRRKQM